MKKICSIDLIFTNMKLLSVDSYSQVRLSTKYIQCSNTVSLFLKLALAFKAWTQSEFWIQMRTCWIFYDYCCCQLLALRRALKVVVIMCLKNHFMVERIELHFYAPKSKLSRHFSIFLGDLRHALQVHSNTWSGK